MKRAHHSGHPSLVPDDAGGEPLDRSLGAPMEVGRFLRLAILIVGALAGVHRQNIVYENIKPQSILIDESAGKARLADVERASLLAREQEAAGRPSLIRGALAYMSPEQTGRMNRAVDQRTDLYSLGVTFYEMLTGRLPFHARDPLEWMHCHIARAPVPPSELVGGVPEVLSNIVLKLLAKVTEDRYQSATGLARDLERCLDEWTHTGQITPFPLGRQDVSERFQIAQRLYGREEQIGLLLRALDRVVATGRPEVIMVSGYSGIGKSSLVQELHRPVLRERGFFLSGKFDQLKRDIPYSIIAQAFTSLILQLLSESEERVASWRRALKEALGVNGRLLVDVIPPIELIIGPQPPVPELPLTEAKDRFNLVFRQFLGVFARKEHPLVLFIDDLQWLDPASLVLFEHLVTHPDTRYLFVIGAYRSNEVGPSHPLTLAIEHMRGANAEVHEIAVEPLALDHLTQLISDTLRHSPEDSRELAQLVHEKTEGNPFFAIQFLTELHQEGLIRFDPALPGWSLDVSRIRDKGFTDNVGELMAARLKRLSPATLRKLELVACMGSAADVQTLALVQGSSIAACHQDLLEAVQQGLLLHRDGVYRFSHDRVFQAAHALIPAQELAPTHLRLGRLLLEHTPEAEIEEHVFDIVYHLNLASALVTDPAEQERLARLNLIAGKRAKASTAFAAASGYFATGRGQLAPGGWDTQYELAFALHLEEAQSDYLRGCFEEATGLITVLLSHAKAARDQVAAHRLRMDIHMARGESESACLVAIECLKLFGIDLDRRPTSEQVNDAVEQVWERLGDRRIEELIDLPWMTDADAAMAMAVMSTMYMPAYYTDKLLRYVLICRMVELSLRGGNSEASSLAYAAFGAMIGPALGRYLEGDRFGRLALDLAEKYGFVASKARICNAYGHLTSFWVHPYQVGIDSGLEGFRTGLQAGDLAYAYVCGLEWLQFSFIDGAPLVEVGRGLDQQIDLARTARFEFIADHMRSLRALVRSLRGEAERPSSASARELDQAAFEARLGRWNDPILTFWYMSHKLQARFTLGDHPEALAALRQADAHAWVAESLVQFPEYVYFAALTLAVRHDDAPPEEQADLLRRALAHRDQLIRWAQLCPCNFRCKSALVSAEVARIKGDALEAEQGYEQAIQAARGDGFVQNEAMSWELASRFYRRRGMNRIADLYLREARDGYARWGAYGKLRQLERRWPQLLETRALQAATLTVQADQIDLLSAVKASQTIASEIVLSRLVRTLIEVVLQQGGAQRGVLLLTRDGELRVEAEATVRAEGVTVQLLDSAPLSASTIVPRTIVQFVFRTRQPVVSQHAAEEKAFALDDYITRQKPRSVLCVPMLRQGQVRGLLYLENNLVSGSFSADRLTVLELLAAQASISLENALLLDSEHIARTAAEEAEQRAAFLARASAVLAESLDAEEVVPRLTRLMVPFLADWCVVDVMEDGGVKRLSATHADPEKEPLLGVLQHRFQPQLDGRFPASEVLRSGQLLLLPDLSAEELKARCQNEEHERLICALGTRSLLVVPLIARGRIAGALSLVSASAQRYGQRELALAQEVAQRAAIAMDNAALYRQSQEAIRTRDVFLSIASHELRTPLTSLQLQLQSSLRLVCGRSAGEVRLDDVTRRLTGAVRQTKRLGSFIDTLLDQSRLTAGRFQLQRERSDLAEVVRDVIGQFAEELSRTGSQLRLIAEQPAVGFWDRLRIEQVVTNLLSNAVKFGQRKPIEVSVVPEGDRVTLRVRDRGIGIEPHMTERIFQKFERAVSERHYGGLGLGLYISRQIVEAHGGKIVVERNLGEGSTFTVELPLGDRASETVAEQR